MKRSKRNLTVALDERVAQKVRMLAASRDTSVSQLLADLLAGLARDEAGTPLALAPTDPQEDAPRTPLPDFLRPLFWEHDFDALAWPSDRDLVIAKVLEVGDPEAFAWLRSTIGSDYLRNWLVARGGRGLDLRRIRYFEAILGIPSHVADRWIRALESDPWASRLSS